MKFLIALITWGLIQLVTGDTVIHMVSYHGKEPVCLKVGQKLICNIKNINGIQVDQQATYSPSDQISLDYRPDCREKIVMVCVLKNVDFNLPHVYYHEDGCFSNNARGDEYLKNNMARFCLNDQIAVSCKNPKLDANPFVSSKIPSTTERSCEGLYGHSGAPGSGGSFLPPTSPNSNPNTGPSDLEPSYHPQPSFNAMPAMPKYLKTSLSTSSQPDDELASIQPIEETEEDGIDNEPNLEFFENTKRSVRKYFSA